MDTRARDMRQAKRRASRTIAKRLEAGDNPKKVLKPEEDQGYTSVLPAVKAREQLQKPRDMPKELKARTAQKGKKAVTRDVPEKHRARESGLLEAAVYAHREGSLKTGL
jgi:hypothetical protein